MLHPGGFGKRAVALIGNRGGRTGLEEEVRTGRRT